MKRFLTQCVLSYLRFFARRSLKKHNPTIIGIAGSVGKSSTRLAVEAILRTHFRILSVGNSETGIPLGILGMMPEDYSAIEWLKMLLKAPFRTDTLKNKTYLVAEMGIDDPYPPKNMEYLLTILKPDIAVSLNVSATHTQQFEKVLTPQQQSLLSPADKLDFLVKKIAEDDTKIMTESGCRVGIYYADDPLVRSFVEKSPPPSLLSFGSDMTNTIAFTEYSVTLTGTRYGYVLHSGDKPKEFSLHFPTHVLPLEYREVFAAAILVALQTALTLEQITSTLQEHFTLPKGRASIFTGINDSVIFDSSYNASKEAVIAFLDLLKTLKKQTKRDVVMIFGDMRELGEEAQLEHEQVAAYMRGIVDEMYLVGPLTRKYVLPIIQQDERTYREIRWFDSAHRVGEFLKENLTQNALVLVKGSQNTLYLEEAIKYILKDKTDEKKLCRQSDYWLSVKKV